MAELLDGSDHPVVLAQALLRRQGQHRVDEGDVDVAGAHFAEVARFLGTGHRKGL
jgi:hypothetical protein